MLGLRWVRVVIPDGIHFAFRSCGNSRSIIDAKGFNSSAVGDLVPFWSIGRMHNHAPHLSGGVAVWPIWEGEIILYILVSWAEHTWFQSSLR